MICDKCNTQFKSATPISESKRIIGLCKNCGTRAKYNDIPVGFIGGAITAVTSTPFFFLLLFNWVSLAYILVTVAFCSLVVWFLTVKIGGKVYFESAKEYEKGSFLFKTLGGVLGLIVGFTILLLFMSLLS